MQIQFPTIDLNLIPARPCLLNPTANLILRFGEPPEAKQLLAELGEGRGGAGASGPVLPPATGVYACMCICGFAGEVSKHVLLLQQLVLVQMTR